MVEQGIVGLLSYLAVIAVVFLQAFKLPIEQRFLMLSLLLIAVASQFTLTLNGRMFIWFAYLLIVIRADLEQAPKTLIQVYQLRLA